MTKKKKSLVRVLAFFLAFSVEVRVRANTQGDIQAVTENTKGEVLLSGSKFDTKLQPRAVIQMPFILQSLKKSQAKFKLEHFQVSLGPDSLLEVQDLEHFKLYRGQVLIESIVKSPPQVKIESPHGLISLNGSGLIKVTTNQTTLDVLRGLATLTERVQPSKVVSVNEGYSSWIGGRSLHGNHEFGAVESSSWRDVVKSWSELAQTTSQAFRDKVYQYGPKWREALKSTTAKLNEKVKDDFKAFDEYLAQEEKKVQAVSQERFELRKLFKSKTTAEPSENIEYPSESRRVPASDVKSSDIEYSDKSEL